jgi:large subunit ribosomal protein L17
MLRNLAASLFLTELDQEGEAGAPKVQGRVITTLQKAKEVRPLVERCITIARRALPSIEEARSLEPEAKRGSSEWKKWREGEGWQKWAKAAAPGVNARRRVFSLLRDKTATKIVFETIAPRFRDRPGGYTRILKLARPRVGDAGTRAILEFVGVRDRKVEKAAKPAFNS